VIHQTSHAAETARDVATRGSMTKASVAAAILKSIEKPQFKKRYGRKWCVKKAQKPKEKAS
jgi:hypothetical protein